jgi:Spy/CpxP family protein refolding chaperone
MKLKFIGGFLLAVLLVCTPIDAMGHKGKKEGLVEKMTKELNLSSSQVNQIEAINQRYKAIHESVAENIKPLRKKVKEKSHSDSPNYTEIRALLEQISPHRIDMHINRMKHKQEIMSVLNAKQKEKFKQSREKRKKKYKKRV